MLLFNEQNPLKRVYFEVMEVSSIFHIKIVGRDVK